MRPRIMVLGLLVCAGGLTVGGQSMATPDVIGLYFDTEAQSHCVSLPPGVHTAWLAVTNLSAVALAGWECMILTDGPVTVLQWGLLNDAINAYQTPQFGVGLRMPMLKTPVMLLLEISFLLESSEPVSFYVHPVFFPSIPGVPVYAAGFGPGDLRPLFQSTGGVNFAVAVINGDCAVQDEARSWGEVKVLYR